MDAPLVLLSGFEPFGERARNPSERVVRRLLRRPPEGVRVEGLVLPVDAARAVPLLLNEVDRLQPQAVVCLGEAPGRPAISLERVAVNLLDFSIPDNTGQKPQDEPVVPGGPAAYFATLPLREMQAAMQEANVPTVLSLSAGSYLCNQVLYALLHHLARDGRPVPAGFIHLPSLPEEEATRERPGPSMDLALSTRGVRVALAALAAWLCRARGSS